MDKLLLALYYQYFLIQLRLYYLNVMYSRCASIYLNKNKALFYQLRS